MKSKHYYTSSIIDDVEQDKTLLYIEYLDDNSQLVKKELFQDGDIVQVDSWKYENGKIMEDKIEYLQTANETKTNYKYENELLLSKEEFSNGDTSNLVSYMYNQNNKSTSIVQTDPDNVCLHKVLTEYDGLEEVVQYYDKEDYVYLQQIINKNEKGQAIKVDKSSFKLDSNKVEQEEMVTFLLTYDDQGNIQTQEVHRDNELIHKLTTNYNSNKLPTDETEVDYLRKSETKSTYIYDTQGRLINKSKIANEQLLFEEKHYYDNNELIRVDRKELSENIYLDTRISIEIK